MRGTDNVYQARQADRNGQTQLWMNMKRSTP